MKTNKTIHLMLLLVLPFVFSNCTSKKSSQITNKKDYKVYLEVNDNKKLQDINKEIEFWQTKFDAAPTQFSYLITLASQYSQLFEIKGSIEDLYKAEKLLVEANEKFVEQNAGIHRAIARNYISQHRFKEALAHLEKAQELGENRQGTNKMLFDVYMELGSYDLAKEKLTAIQTLNDFDYLIRLAKWNDHKGDLDTAISCMEKAKKIAEDENNKGLKIWVYSNIGDYYGHAGRIKESYNHYLKTLAIDNHNTYALKGIAWISFSYERNPEQALEIINNIESKHLVPDLYLLKAEIADFQHNKQEKNRAIKKYNEVLASHNYGDMYNKYNVLLLAESPNEVHEAIVIAKREIQNRPTPESYDLLAWSFLKIGEKEKALKIIQKHTINKSFEPHILYHNAEILKANNLTEKVKPIKTELLANIYELGPSLESKIKNL